jgi:hypothetical protein
MFMNKYLTSLPADGKEPEVDLARCSVCEWEGPITDCGTERDGDWETGYYDVDVCPKCEDGGCIDEYFMSETRTAEWEAWFQKQPVWHLKTYPDYLLEEADRQRTQH